MEGARPNTTTDDPAVSVLSLSQLFEQHVDDVFGYVLRRCGSRQVAEDVAAETFAEAARAHRAGRADQVGRSWLLHVAKMRLIDHWRRDARHRGRIERLTAVSIGSSFRLNTTVDGDPYVIQALESLSSRQRAVLVLRYVDDYSVSEVAETIGVSYAATESLLARGRRALLAAYEALVAGELEAEQERRTV